VIETDLQIILLCFFTGLFIVPMSTILLQSVVVQTRRVYTGVREYVRQSSDLVKATGKHI